MKPVSWLCCVLLALRAIPALAGEPAAAVANAVKPVANTDLAYGAYQRGLYLTALNEAKKRLAANPNDGVAMTLIGQLYDQGLGVGQDFAAAARWYKDAAGHGDEQGTFLHALAELQGKGVPKDRDGAAALFAKAAAMNNSGALYNLGVLAVENNGVAPDFAKAVGYFAAPPNSAIPMPPMRWRSAIVRAGACLRMTLPRPGGWNAPWTRTRSRPRSNMPIMLFNGIGVAKDETAAAKLFLKAAQEQNAVAQDRAARLLVLGRGVPKNMIEAMKWHVLASAAAKTTPGLRASSISLRRRKRSRSTRPCAARSALKHRAESAQRSSIDPMRMSPQRIRRARGDGRRDRLRAAAPVDRCVDLRRRERRMAEQFLDRAQIATLAEKVRGEGMAQRMRRCRFRQAERAAQSATASWITRADKGPPLAPINSGPSAGKRVGAEFEIGRDSALHRRDHRTLRSCGPCRRLSAYRRCRQARLAR